MKIISYIALAANLAAGQTTQSWLDRTTSASPQEMRQAIASLKEHLPAIMHRHGGSSPMREVEVFGFASDAFGVEPIATIRLRRLVENPCGVLSEAARLISASKRQHDRDCEDRKNAAQAQWMATTKEAVATQFPTTLQPAPPAECTAIYELLLRLQRDKPEIAVIITDGQDMCSAGRTLQKLTPPQGSKVFMVVVNTSTKGVRYYDHFVRTEAKWREVAPWMKVITVAEIPKLAQ